MNADPLTWLMLAAGSLLLAGGGAVLRGSSVHATRTVATRLRRELEDAISRESQLTRSSREAEEKLAKAREEITSLRGAIERSGWQAAKESDDLERQLKEAKAEVERLVHELMNEQQMSERHETAFNELRTLLHAAQEEARDARTAVETATQQAKAAEERARVAEERAKTAARRAPEPIAPKKDDPALVAARNELAETKKVLTTTTEERDTARARVEALERLVEGVRARSKELARELSELRARIVE